jgi:hypothetical protein
MEELEIQPRGAKALEIHIGEGGASLDKTSKFFVFVQQPCLYSRIQCRATTQVIAQAWNSWKSNHVEQKRLGYMLAKVTRHWTNRAIAQAWNSWYSNRLEQRRLRSIVAKVSLRWKNRVSTMFLLVSEFGS